VEVAGSSADEDIGVEMIKAQVAADKSDKAVND